MLHSNSGSLAKNPFKKKKKEKKDSLSFMLNHPVTALQEGNKTVDRISAGYLMYAHGEMISLIIDY